MILQQTDNSTEANVNKLFKAIDKSDYSFSHIYSLSQQIIDNDLHLGIAIPQYVYPNGKLNQLNIDLLLDLGKSYHSNISNLESLYVSLPDEVVDKQKAKDFNEYIAYTTHRFFTLLIYSGISQSQIESWIQEKSKLDFSIEDSLTQLFAISLENNILEKCPVSLSPLYKKTHGVVIPHDYVDLHPDIELPFYYGGIYRGIEVREYLQKKTSQIILDSMDIFDILDDLDLSTNISKYHGMLKSIFFDYFQLLASLGMGELSFKYNQEAYYITLNS